jgi:hypothetical protein
MGSLRTQWGERFCQRENVAFLNTSKSGGSTLRLGVYFLPGASTMHNPSDSEETTPGRLTARDNWFTVATLPYIPPSRLSEYDTRYDQGLDQLLYLQTLIDEEIER